ncbi:hypothetical protein L1887_53615 [Cichorium endivia]|nr:hypothetical protein L1887_53615 [Cichorium endivia]
MNRAGFQFRRAEKWRLKVNFFGTRLLHQKIPLRCDSWSEERLLTLGAVRTHNTVPSQSSDCARDDGDRGRTLEPLCRDERRASDDAPEWIRGKRSALARRLHHRPPCGCINVSHCAKHKPLGQHDSYTNERCWGLLTQEELPDGRVDKTGGRGVEAAEHRLGHLVLAPRVVQRQQR